MSSIDPELKARLDDYLDDRLSASQREAFERMLSEESDRGRDLQQELTVMSTMRDALQRLDAESSRHTLPDNFPERVVAATLSRASKQKLPSDHPLVRLAGAARGRVGDGAEAEQISHDSGPVDAGRRIIARELRWLRKSTAFAMSIAASVAIALVVSRQGTPVQVSSSDSVLPDAVATEQNFKQPDASEFSAAAVRPGTVWSDPAEVITARSSSDASNLAIAGSDLKYDFNQDLADGIADDAKIDQMADPDHSVADQLLANQDAPLGKSPLSPGLAALDAPSAAASQRSDAISPLASSAVSSSIVKSNDSGGTRLATIVVLEVRQTDQGRFSGAVRRAMRQSGIQHQDQRQLSKALADSAASTVDLDDDEMVSMIYLNAPAKRIDQFYSNLFSDRQGIRSVALAIATDAPVLDLVQSAIPDPTVTATQPATAVELTGRSSTIARLPFMDVSRDSLRGLTGTIGLGQVAAPGGSGPDFTAQLLVVVR